MDRQVFASSADLEVKLEEIHKPNGLKMHLEQIKGSGMKTFLESRKNNYFHLVSDKNLRKSNSEDEQLVSDAFFASLLNEDGEMMIGESVFRASVHGAFLYEPDKKDEVDKLEKEMGELPNSEARSEDFALSDGITFYSHNDLGNNTTSDNTIIVPPNDGTGGGGPPPPACERASFFSTNFPVTQVQDGSNGIGDRITVRHTEGNRRHRLRYYRENWAIYQSAGYNITNLERNSLGIWVRRPADYSELIADGTIIFKFSGSPDIPYDYDSRDDEEMIFCGDDASRIDFNLNWHVGQFVLPIEDWKPVKSWETVSANGDSYTSANNGQFKSRLKVEDN